MEVGVPTSFIPHDATTPLAPHHYEQTGGLGELVTLIAIVTFVASGALAVGTYLYLQLLNQQSTQKQQQIKIVQDSLDTGLIKQITTLDKRMNSAESLLGAHIAPSAFFSVLNQTTLTTVSFQSLSFDASDPKGISVKMAGIARDINSVALQADLFGKGGVITDAIFSGIDQQADGVHFAVAGYVNPAGVNYVTLATGQTAAGVNPLPASSAAAGATSAADATNSAVPVPSPVPATTTKK